MKKKSLRIIGVIMVLIAAAFVAFAFMHPELSFPWSNTITYIIYGAYALIALILLIAPVKKK